MVAPIAEVMLEWFPDWAPPKDNPKWKWLKTRCPFHDESNPSASISYQLNAFNCFACGVKGDIIALIRRKEGLGYREAVARAETVSARSSQPLLQKPRRKPGRRTFGG